MSVHTVKFRFLSLLLVCVLPSIYAFTLRVNSTDSNITPEMVRRLGFVSDSGWTISLGELSPLVFELDRLSVTAENGEIHVIPLDQVGGNIFQVYLSHDGEEYSVSYPGGSVTAAAAADISGSLLQPRPLEVWISWEGTAALRREILQFSKLFNIPVTIQDIPSIPQKLVSYGRSGERMPDAVMLQSDHLPQYLQERLLQPMGGTLSSDIHRNGIEAFTYDGTLWAAPLYVDSHVLIYNPEILMIPDGEEVTMEEIEKLLENLKEHQGITPASWNLYSAYWLVPFIYGFGKDALLDEDGSITVTDDATRRALAYLMDLRNRGLLDPLERDGMMAAFLQGRVGMILTGSFAIPGLEQLGVPFAVAPYPILEETGRALAPLLDYKGFAVTRRAHNPAAAFRLMEYLTSRRVQESLPSGIGKLPADAHAIEGAHKQNPYADVLRVSLERGTVIPPYPAYSIFKDVFWSMLRLIVSGRIPLEDGLNRAQTLIDNRLQDVLRYQ